jgi:hypothetical protein
MTTTILCIAEKRPLASPNRAALKGRFPSDRQGDVMTRRRWVCVPGVRPFENGDHNYMEYAFLADVRNEWGIPPIAQPRGVPVDASLEAIERLYNGYDTPEGYSHSWLTLKELTEFYYDATLEDQVPTVMVGDTHERTLKELLELDGATLIVDGTTYDRQRLIDVARAARISTYRKFLGPVFFGQLAELKAVGAERIVFWFY